MNYKRVIRKIFLGLGYNVKKLTGDERRYMSASYDPESWVPDDALSLLREDSPRLLELRNSYRKLDLPVSVHTVWDESRLKGELSLPWFRGDNAYVWQFRQVRGEIRLKQYLTLQYVESRDELKLLDVLDEDGAFGCWTFRYGKRDPVSRDLLESVNEINFLERHVQLSNVANLKVIDVGAGYGRLAYRMAKALPNLERYDCVDAVPESTFLCEYYLNFRGVSDKASAIPLTEHSRLSDRYDLAVNIHSFSECTLVSVTWWLKKLAELRVPYLLIVPNQPEELLTSEADGSKRDFAPVIEAAGYELVQKAPVFDDEELADLIGVRDHFFLFHLRGSSAGVGNV